MDGLMGAVIRIIIFLPVVVILAYLSIKYGLGKTQQWQKNSHLQVVDRLVLGPKSSLYVVKVVDKYYLLAVGEAGISLLKELEAYPETQNCLNSQSELPFDFLWQKMSLEKWKRRGKTS